MKDNTFEKHLQKALEKKTPEQIRTMRDAIKHGETQ